MMIVAVDGQAGAGKSTVAFALARRLGFLYLDTGAMYRALTWLARNEGTNLADSEELARLAREHPVVFDSDGRVVIDDKDVTDEIREASIDRLVPIVARHVEVRDVMRERQRSLGAGGDAVIEGRDIGTVVAPNAEVKVFLIADEAERARRRNADRPGVGTDRLAADLRSRDERDAVNARPAEDAIVLDTTLLGVGDVIDRIEALVAKARAYPAGATALDLG
jgi:cytidylate kinase